MANVTYKKPEDQNYMAQSNAASANGANRDAAYMEQQHNTSSMLTGKGGYSSSHMGSYLYPQDVGSDVNSFMGSGNRGATGAANAVRNQKIATDTNLSGYYDPVSDANANAFASQGFQYSDPYGFMDQVNDLNGRISDALGSYGGSTYSDYLNSPDYQDLSDRYRQAGQLAMEDTLGTASQMSGGLDSSYATAAAQQAYNGYMSNLQSAAQSAYQNKLSNQAAQLSALQGERGNLAGLYATDYNRAYQSDRDTQNDFYNWYSLYNNMGDSRLAAQNSQSNTEASLGQNQQSIDLANRQFDAETDQWNKSYDLNKQSMYLNANSTLQSLNLERRRYGLPALTIDDLMKM